MSKYYQLSFKQYEPTKMQLILLEEPDKGYTKVLRSFTLKACLLFKTFIPR